MTAHAPSTGKLFQSLIFGYGMSHHVKSTKTSKPCGLCAVTSSLPCCVGSPLLLTYVERVCVCVCVRERERERERERFVSEIMTHITSESGSSESDNAAFLSQTSHPFHSLLCVFDELILGLESLKSLPANPPRRACAVSMSKL